MSMHIVGPWMTTLKTGKKNSKITKTKYLELVTQHKAYNKEMKANNMPVMSFDEYVDYVYGKSQKFKRDKNESYSQPKTSHRETKAYTSLNTTGGSTAKKEVQKYTGDLILGIATMHKSNAVPILNKEHALDTAQMRRN